ncbi:MAG: hypothetical protein ACK5ZJ_02810, partial [Acidobacteriota bacterium]
MREAREASFNGPPSRHELVEAIAFLILGPKVDFGLPAVTGNPGGQIQQAQAIRGNSPMRQLGYGKRLFALNQRQPAIQVIGDQVSCQPDIV